MADATTQADTATDTEGSDDTSTPEAKPDKDWQKEAEKWQKLAQKHEGRAKSNADAAKELDDLKLSSLGEKERAVAEARSEAEQAAASKWGGRLVDAEIRIAAAGRSFDTDALLSLDRSQFLTDDGEADVDAIRTWVEEHSKSVDETPEEPKQGPLAGIDLGQGSNQHVSIGDDAGIMRMLGDLAKK